MAHGFHCGQGELFSAVSSLLFNALMRPKETARGGCPQVQVARRGGPVETRPDNHSECRIGADIRRTSLGKGTVVLAKAMKQFDPDANWHKTEEMQAETAGK